jgi:hypothetical protein
MNLTNNLNQTLERSFSYFIRLIKYENFDDKFLEPIILEEFNFHFATCECIDCFSKIKQKQYIDLFSYYNSMFCSIVDKIINNKFTDCDIAKLIYNQCSTMKFSS